MGFAIGVGYPLIQCLSPTSCGSAPWSYFALYFVYALTYLILGNFFVGFHLFFDALFLLLSVVFFFDLLLLLLLLLQLLLRLLALILLFDFACFFCFLVFLGGDFLVLVLPFLFIFLSWPLVAS